MDKIKLIVNFLFKNGIGRVWVGNWIYNKEGETKNE